jgi:hypothetical protein
MVASSQPRTRCHTRLRNGLKKYLIPDRSNPNIALSFKHTLYSIFLYFARDEYNSATLTMSRKMSKFFENSCHHFVTTDADIASTESVYISFLR